MDSAQRLDARAREQAARGIPVEDDTDAQRAELFIADVQAVAGTVSGRRFLTWLISNCHNATGGVFYDARDYVNIGRREACMQLEAVLRNVLPRDKYLEIVYPKKEEM